MLHVQQTPSATIHFRHPRHRNALPLSFTVSARSASACARLAASAQSIPLAAGALFAVSLGDDRIYQAEIDHSVVGGSPRG